MSLDRVAGTMRDVATRMAVPGLVWATISGPRQTVQIGSAGPLGHDTIFRIASITKPIVGVLALRLVDEGVFALDDAIDAWLPEFADRRVLRERGGALTDTVPAARPTTVRDVLAMGSGLGWDMKAAPDDPLAREFDARELGSGWEPPVVRPDRWAELAGALPMAHQPGEGWMYQYSYDVLTVLIERATRRRLDLLLRDKVFAPLDMDHTGYAVPMNDVDRVPSAWFPNRRGDFVEVAPTGDPRLMNVPVFRSGATGLLSSAGDLAKFAQMLLREGRGPRGRVISRASFAALTTDSVVEPARAMAREFLEPNLTWGLGVGVDLGSRYPGSHAGRFGWDGGTGTSLWVDPVSGVGGVLLTRQGLGTPEPPEYLEAFWGAVHA